MAVGDANEIPWYGYKFSRELYIIKNDGTRFAADLTGLAAELQDVGGTNTALTAPSVIGTNKGACRVDLTAAQMAVKSGSVLVSATNTGAMVRDIPINTVRLAVARSGTAQAGTTTTLQLAAGQTVALNQLAGTWIGVPSTSPSGPAGEIRQIVSNTAGAGATVTVDVAFSTAPTNTSTYEQGSRYAVELASPVLTDIAGGVLNATQASYVAAGSIGERISRIPNAAPGANGGLPTVNGSNEVAVQAASVRTAVGMASGNLDAQLTAMDDFIDTEVSAIKAKTDLLPAVAAGTNGGLPTVNGSNEIAGVQGITESDIAAIKAKTDNLPAAPANEATLGTIAGYIDTEVGAIKAKTDQLAFTGGAVDSNVKTINGSTVTGDGTPTTNPWRKA